MLPSTNMSDLKRLEQAMKQHVTNDNKRFAEFGMKLDKYHEENRARLQELSFDMKGQNKELAEIKQQTITTNGRVSKLENWKYILIGGLAVVSAVIIPLFLQLFQK